MDEYPIALQYERDNKEEGRGGERVVGLPCTFDTCGLAQS